ncbi:hypothetical protein [Mesorhizobium amorphae]|uniref:hypothetical protein n=1 Tax=Mesorhizobium amorphae TaxID=71433 RepID=UPI00177B5185|nr:hypothetical protein [Mesorhizobium amorphae]
MKDDVGTDLQARKLAKEAAVSLHPHAAATERKLQQAFRLIPVAKRLRGESEAARNAALDLLDEVENDSAENEH